MIQEMEYIIKKFEISQVEERSLKSKVELLEAELKMLRHLLLEEDSDGTDNQDGDYSDEDEKDSNYNFDEKDKQPKRSCTKIEKVRCKQKETCKSQKVRSLEKIQDQFKDLSEGDSEGENYNLENSPTDNHGSRMFSTQPFVSSPEKDAPGNQVLNNVLKRNLFAQKFFDRQNKEGSVKRIIRQLKRKYKTIHEKRNFFFQIFESEGETIGETPRHKKLKGNNYQQLANGNEIKEDSLLEESVQEQVNSLLSSFQPLNGKVYSKIVGHNNDFSSLNTDSSKKSKVLRNKNLKQSFRQKTEDHLKSNVPHNLSLCSDNTKDNGFQLLVKEDSHLSNLLKKYQEDISSCSEKPQNSNKEVINRVDVSHNLLSEIKVVKTLTLSYPSNPPFGMPSPFNQITEETHVESRKHDKPAIKIPRTVPLESNCMEPKDSELSRIEKTCCDLGKTESSGQVLFCVSSKTQTAAVGETGPVNIESTSNSRVVECLGSKDDRRNIEKFSLFPHKNINLCFDSKIKVAQNFNYENLQQNPETASPLVSRPLENISPIDKLNQPILEHNNHLDTFAIDSPPSPLKEDLGFLSSESIKSSTPCFIKGGVSNRHIGNNIVHKSSHEEHSTPISDSFTDAKNTTKDIFSENIQSCAEQFKLSLLPSLPKITYNYNSFNLGDAPNNNSDKSAKTVFCNFENFIKSSSNIVNVQDKVSSQPNEGIYQNTYSSVGIKCTDLSNHDILQQPIKTADPSLKCQEKVLEDKVTESDGISQKDNMMDMFQQKPAQPNLKKLMNLKDSESSVIISNCAKDDVPGENGEICMDSGVSSNLMTAEKGDQQFNSSDYSLKQTKMSSSQINLQSAIDEWQDASFHFRANPTEQNCSKNITSVSDGFLVSAASPGDLQSNIVPATSNSVCADVMVGSTKHYSTLSNSDKIFACNSESKNDLKEIEVSKESLITSVDTEAVIHKLTFPQTDNRVQNIESAIFPLSSNQCDVSVNAKEPLNQPLDCDQQFQQIVSENSTVDDSNSTSEQSIDFTGFCNEMNFADPRKLDATGGFLEQRAGSHKVPNSMENSAVPWMKASSVLPVKDQKSSSILSYESSMQSRNNLSEETILPDLDKTFVNNPVNETPIYSRTENGFVGKDQINDCTQEIKGVSNSPSMFTVETSEQPQRKHMSELFPGKKANDNAMLNLSSRSLTLLGKCKKLKVVVEDCFAKSNKMKQNIHCNKTPLEHVKTNSFFSQNFQGGNDIHKISVSPKNLNFSFCDNPNKNISGGGKEFLFSQPDLVDVQSNNYKDKINSKEATSAKDDTEQSFQSVFITNDIYKHKLNGVKHFKGIKTVVTESNVFKESCGKKEIQMKCKENISSFYDGMLSKCKNLKVVLERLPFSKEQLRDAQDRQLKMWEETPDENLNVRNISLAAGETKNGTTHLLSKSKELLESNFFQKSKCPTILCGESSISEGEEDQTIVDIKTVQNSKKDVNRCKLRYIKCPTTQYNDSDAVTKSPTETYARKTVLKNTLHEMAGGMTESTIAQCNLLSNCKDLKVDLERCTADIEGKQKHFKSISTRNPSHNIGELSDRRITIISDETPQLTDSHTDEESIELPSVLKNICARKTVLKNTLNEMAGGTKVSTITQCNLLSNCKDLKVFLERCNVDIEGKQKHFKSISTRNPSHKIELSDRQITIISDETPQLTDSHMDEENIELPSKKKVTKVKHKKVEISQSTDSNTDEESIEPPPKKKVKKVKHNRKKQECSLQTREVNLFAIFPKSIALCFQTLEQSLFADNSLEPIIRNLVSGLSDRAVVSKNSDIILYVLKYLSQSEKNPIVKFRETRNMSTLFPLVESCITSALLIMDSTWEDPEWLPSLMNTIRHLILAREDIELFGSCALCRVLTEICKCRQDRQELITLICDILKRRHKFAPMLIASIVGVWMELFETVGHRSEEEEMFFGSILLGAKNRTSGVKVRQWRASSDLVSQFISASIVCPDKKTVNDLIKLIQKKCTNSSYDKEYMLTTPLVIFAACNGWEWSKEELVYKYVIPSVKKYSEMERNKRALSLFCNLYAEICYFCPKGSMPEKLLMDYFNRGNDDHLIQDAVAPALIKLLLLRNQLLPENLVDWVQSNEHCPTVLSLKPLFQLKIMADSSDITIISCL